MKWLLFPEGRQRDEGEEAEEKEATTTKKRTTGQETVRSHVA
jgi:hypothetical protein